jgi:hypothetical protein
MGNHDSYSDRLFRDEMERSICLTDMLVEGYMGLVSPRWCWCKNRVKSLSGLFRVYGGVSGGV